MKCKDKIYQLIETGAKIGMGFLPSPISNAFNVLVDNVRDGVLSRRTEKWKEDVITRLNQLESDYENLINSESFATAVIKTSEIAVKTESEEKRQILANALINSYSQNIKEDKLLIFLQLIEKYSVLHVQIIRFLHDEYMNQKFCGQAPTFSVLFKMKFINVEDSYLKKTTKDLQNDYLVEEFRDDARVEFMGQRFELLTSLGKDFYNYLKPASKE